MATADAMIADVVAHPDDDAPRLVYADWLLEQDDPSERDRGEFIQLSCELAKLDDADAGVRAPKVRRAMELLGKHELVWADAMLAPLPSRRITGSDVDWTWSRGFIERYRMGGITGVFRMGELEKVTKRTPIRDVWVSCAGDDTTREFLNRPWLSSLRSLSVEFRVLADTLRAFFSTKALHQLEHLAVSFNDQRQIHVLAQHAAAFTKLKSFEVTFSPDESVQKEQHDALASLAFGPRLKHFGVTTSYDSLDRYLQLPFPIESLRISADSSGRVIQQLADQRRAFPSLRALDITRNNARFSLSWTFDHLDALLQSRGGFRSLKLGRPDSVAGFERVMEREAMRSLEVLHLRYGVRFADREAEVIAQSPQLTRLRELEISNSELTSAGAKALLDSPRLQTLRRLSLRGNHRIGASIFASAKGFEELELLDLRDNAIPERGAAAERLRKRFGAAARVGYDPVG